MQSTLTRIEGPNLTLRLIQPEDADYVYGLRMNPAYNQHLSQVQGTAEDQRQWIERYKTREADGQEFYYIIERNDGQPCGVVRLYDLDEESFTWGSWILDGNKPAKAALESAVLSFALGFNVLDREFANVDVRIENKHARAFYQRLGMIETSRTQTDIFFIYPRTRFEADRDKYIAILNVENKI